MEIETSGQETTVDNQGAESSSESASVAQSQSDSSVQGGEASTQLGNEKPTPFHEHPRFKELVEQKNQFATKYSDLENRYQQMERRMQQLAQEREAVAKPKPEDPLLARLKQIDPEFGSRFEKLSSLEQQVEQFKQFQAEMQEQQMRSKAESTLTSLYDQHKVPDNLKSMYRQQIENLAYNSPNAGLNDLEKFFKQAHENITKFVEDFKRQERSSYVTAKKSDTTPATQSGGAAAPVSSGKSTMNNLEDVKAAILARAKQSSQKI
jgi:hypothetical protein